MVGFYMEKTVVPCAPDCADVHILGPGVPIDASEASRAWCWSPSTLADVDLVTRSVGEYSSRIGSVSGVNVMTRLNNFGMSPLLVGHPSLRVREVFSDLEHSPQDRIGVVLHKEHWPRWVDDLERRGYHVIQSFCDESSRDPLEEVRERIIQILSCDRIISTSLAGLGISNAFGVPYVYARDRDRPIFKPDAITHDCLPFMEHFSFIGVSDPLCVDISEFVKANPSELEDEMFEKAVHLNPQHAADFNLFELLKSADSMGL